MQCTVNFGQLVEDPKEEIAYRRIYMRLAKLEHELGGPEVINKPEDYDEKHPEESWGDMCERLIFQPDERHVAALMIVCVDALIELTLDIEGVSNSDVKHFLREYYYQIKHVVCENDDAIAYHLNTH